jgi:uncharacterized protein YecE (DUF72 family)
VRACAGEDLGLSCAKSRMAASPQLDLFGAPEPAAPRKIGPATAPDGFAELAARMPPGLHFGTSSWAYPGWAGIVYDLPYTQQRIAREGLAAYARHPLMRAVGIDRSYYAPLRPGEFAAYAAEVPGDFRFLVKAHEACTMAIWPRHARYGKVRGQPNERFLDPEYAAEVVVAPAVEGLGDKLGPLLFQFAPQDFSALGGARWLVDRLHKFLQALPRGPLYAVEVRNRDLLSGAYADALADAGVCHCINVYPGMPPARAQWARTRQDRAPALVCRWMLHPAMDYERAEARYDPFDALVDEDPNNREELARVCLQAADLGLPTYVIVNNKAEGSSPRTIARLAQRIGEITRERVSGRPGPAASPRRAS